MNKFLFFIAFTFIVQFNSFAQDAINNYKYIIVPHQFDFQKSEDQYQLNSLTKFLFNKHGYEAYLDSETYPQDLASDNCLALKAIVKDDSGMLTTKLIIHLVNCRNTVVATSEVGKSKLKKRDRSYNQALRNAFLTFEYFDYSYEPKVKEAKSTPKTETVVQEKIAPVEPSDEKIKEVKERIESKPSVESKSIQQEDLLYAQPIDNGFQIVDTEPKKVMILLYSGIPETYIVQGKDAVVYKKAGEWIYAENNGERLMVKGINLKF